MSWTRQRTIRSISRENMALTQHGQWSMILTIIRVSVIIAFVGRVDERVVRAMDVYSNTFCAGGGVLGNGTWVVFGGNQRTMNLLCKRHMTDKDTLKPSQQGVLPPYPVLLMMTSMVEQPYACSIPAMTSLVNGYKASNPTTSPMHPILAAGCRCRLGDGILQLRYSLMDP